MIAIMFTLTKCIYADILVMILDGSVDWASRTH